MAKNRAGGDAAVAPFSPRAEILRRQANLMVRGGARMYEDDVPEPDAEKGRERPSEALGEAEKDRLWVEAALAAQRVLPSVPPRDLA